MISEKKTFPKTEHLSWKRHIELLFRQGSSFIAYPLRVVFFIIDEKDKAPQAPAAILVSVPKRNFKRAVKRNLLKRRIREAYRLHKSDLLKTLEAEGKSMLVAFLYLEKEAWTYQAIEKSMEKALRVLREKVA